MNDRLIITRTLVGQDESPECFMHFLWCPACDDVHRVNSAIPDIDPGRNVVWEWDGDKTFSPSLLVTGGSRDIRCHSFVRGGNWVFLEDSTHRLAGKTVPLMPIPDDFLL